MRAIISLLISMLILFGCGNGHKSENQQGEVNNSESDQDIIAGEMVSTITEISPLEYEYEVKNHTEESITLEFTSSQRVDYSVSTKEGQELFLYSSTASFLAALGEEIIAPGEEFQYKINLTELNLQKGKYILTAWMTPEKGTSYKIAKEFTLE
jgi:Intracellular proteinase inhibitor